MWLFLFIYLFYLKYPGSSIFYHHRLVHVNVLSCECTSTMSNIITHSNVLLLRNYNVNT